MLSLRKSMSLLCLSMILTIACAKASKKAGESAATADVNSLQDSCNSIDRRNNQVCVTAASRWCLAEKGKTAALIGEGDDSRVSINCLNAKWNGDVSLTDLENTTARLKQPQHVSTRAALAKICMNKGQGNVGIANEIGEDSWNVACLQADAVVKATPAELRAFAEDDVNVCLTSDRANLDNCRAAVTLLCQSKGFAGGIAIGYYEKYKNDKSLTAACFMESNPFEITLR